MARWLILCGLLGLGLMMGCVSEVDLQVLRADVETLQQNYRRHDAQVARQLERLETRKAQSRQVLTPLTATIVELRAEVQRLDTALGDLQDTVHNADFTDDMQEETIAVRGSLNAGQTPHEHQEETGRAPAKTADGSFFPRGTEKTRGKTAASQTQNATTGRSQSIFAHEPHGGESGEPGSGQADTGYSTTRRPPPPPQRRRRRQRSIANSPPPAPPQPSQAAPAPPSDGSDVRLYERGLRAYQIGDYESALEFLRHFLKQYTQSPLAGNVQYWIGESLLAQHQYKAAIAAFDHVVQKYPNDTKVPAAMLNQGLAFVQLQDVQRARFFLEQVQKKYADSLEADQAKATLQQIK